jgi:hypothetical protein
MTERMRVRIVSDGTPTGTRVTEAESGAEIAVSELRIVQDWSGRTQEMRAEIVAVMPIVDVVADATVTKRCPYCKRDEA